MVETLEKMLLLWGKKKKSAVCYFQGKKKVEELLEFLNVMVKEKRFIAKENRSAAAMLSSI